VSGAGERTLTVVVAGAANLAVAVAKSVAGLMTGSAAMQAEAAHSIADTATEVFLFIAARRGSRAPDAEHPFGHGRETYLWAFVAALATFVAGAGFSVARGIDTLVSGEGPPEGGMLVSYLVLAFAFLLEGGSLRRALRQAHEEATRTRLALRTYYG
jgi:cation diffusion facilitator family transporter